MLPKPTNERLQFTKSNDLDRLHTKSENTENTALWLKALKVYFFEMTYATCKPQFMHTESGCSYSKLTFRSFPEDFTDLPSRLCISCELRKSPQSGGAVQLFSSLEE